MAAKDGLTVCSLVLPVLYLPALLVGLGLGTLGVIADMFCRIWGRRQLDHVLPYHRPGFRMSWVL